MTLRTHLARQLPEMTSEHDVVALVLDYLSAWTPAELGELPRNCRPTKRLRDAEDVADCAIELTQARIAAADPHPLLLEMEDFFARACVHLSRLERRTVASSAQAPRGA